MIEAVFFDGDQTLWDFQTLMRRSLCATLTELRSLRPGERTDSLTVDSLIADRDAAAADLEGVAQSMEVIRVAAFRRTLSRVGLDEPGLADHLARTYFERRFGDVLLYPDVLPTLTELAKSYRLGLLSNGNSYPERSGLADVFDVVVFAQDHGYSKPDTRLYEVAARKTQLEGSSLAMVGDSVRNDVTGAQCAGWLGLWLNRDDLPTPDGARPDAILRTLTDAPAALAGLAGATTSTTTSTRAPGP